MTTRQSIIDPSVLNELGKMYTTISQTMRELIQNGFDSYANNVYMEINIPENYIKIVDDGVGMNDYVVINHYANVGMSTKQKDISEFPSVPSNLNSKRPKIGKKGMGKLSWILVAKKQETITTCINIPYSIKVNFDANNLQEYEEPTHINKHTEHGTTIILRDLQITDIKEEDINEFVNTTGFLSTAFKEFNINLTVISPSTNISNQKIIKVLAEGYQFDTKGTHNYIESKYINGKTVTIKEEPIQYNSIFRLPSGTSKERSEFWLLSGHMGIKKLNTFEGFSGYINIDNLELVANRNDIQTGEQNKVKQIEAKVVSYLVNEFEKMYISNKVRETDVLIYLDGNQEKIIRMIYTNEESDFQARMIGKYFQFDFYGIGLKRLVDFLKTENVIYYYGSEQKNNADKASYYGYKCFFNSSWNTEYIIKKAFDSAFVQSIEELPKEAYATAGATIKPVGNLMDILKNAGKIFNSLNYAYSKVTSKVQDLERELKEKADSLTDKERSEKEKELEELRKRNKEIQESLSDGSEEYGETDDIETNIQGKKKHFKQQKKKSFKQSEDHYMDMTFGANKMKFGFAYFDDDNVIANIYMQHYIHLNLNNEYIKSAINEKNPLKQLILLTPHMCHEVTHLWSSDHDEKFQMVNNMLLIPTLDHLLKSLPYDSSEMLKQSKNINYEPKLNLPTKKRIIRKKIPTSTLETKIDKTFDDLTKKATDVLSKLD